MKGHLYNVILDVLSSWKLLLKGENVDVLVLKLYVGSQKNIPKQFVLFGMCWALGWPKNWPWPWMTLLIKPIDLSGGPSKGQLVWWAAPYGGFVKFWDALLSMSQYCENIQMKFGFQEKIYLPSLLCTNCFANTTYRFKME